MLQHYADADYLHVHLEPRVPGKTDNAQKLVSKAIAIAQARQRGSGNCYSSKYIILDTDWLSAVEGENTRMKKQAVGDGFKLVFQECCFEAFLLRHFKPYQNATPPNAAEAEKQLTKVWKGYRNGLSAKDLMKELGSEMVRAASMRPQNHDFKELLRDIGLL